MSGKPKLHHYVPRFYLRQFSKETTNNPKIFCFDKKTQKKFPVGISNIGGEQNFYDFKGKLVVEKFFSQLESEFATPYRKLLTAENISALSTDEQLLICYLIASQHLRTRSFRNVIKQSSEFVLNQQKKIISKIDDPTIVKLSSYIQEEPAKNFQLTLLIRSLSGFAHLLFEMKWSLFINNTSTPFWSSDNPLAYSNPFEYNKFDGLGIERIGSQSIFPLSSKLALAIVDPLTYFGHPSTLTVGTPEGITYFNQLQVVNAERYIFSPTDDFSLVEDMFQQNPKLKDIGANRFVNFGN